MKKRFFDTEIWQKPWFRALPPTQKSALLYIMSVCDNVGVWSGDKVAAEFYVGAEVDWEALIVNSNGNLEELDGGKMWLPDFCEFQYGDLSEACKPHQSYIKLLKKHKLYDRVTKGYTKGMDTPKEKEKAKDKDKEYDPAFLIWYEAYPRRIGKKDAAKAWNARMKEGIDPDDLLAARNGYFAKCLKDKTEEKYMMHPATFLGPNERWKDFLNYIYVVPETEAPVAEFTKCKCGGKVFQGICLSCGAKA